MNPTLEVLLKAREHVESGWAKNVGYGMAYAGKCCAMGAIGWASHPEIAQGHGYPPQLEKDDAASGEHAAIKALYYALPKNYQESEPYIRLADMSSAVEYFNDAAEKDEVLSVFDRAIAAVQR
jgi:hypothetical protein